MKFLCCLLFFSSIFATNDFDSLQKKLNVVSKGERLEILKDMVAVLSKKNDTVNALKYTDILVNETKLSTKVDKLKYLLIAINSYKKLNKVDKFIALSKETLLNPENFDKAEYKSIYKLITDYYYNNGEYNNNINLVTLLYKANSKINSLRKEALFARSLAQNYVMLGNLDSALSYGNNNLIYREKLKDTASLGHAYNLLGVINWKKGDLYNAYINYLKAENYCQLGKDTATLLLTYNNLALVFQRLKYYQKAVENIKQGLSLAKKIKYSFGIAYSYKRLADLYLELKRFDEAKQNLDSSIVYANIINRKNMLIDIYYLLGKIYQAEGKYDEALSRYNIGLNSKDKILDKFIVALLLSRRSEIFIIKKNYDLALKDAEEALELSTDNRYTVIQRDNYFKMYKIYKAKGNYEIAINYLEKYNEIKEKILNESIINLINERDIKSTIEKSNEISKRLKKENELQKTIIKNKQVINTFYAIILFIIGIALIIIVYQLIKVRKLNKEIELKNQNLNSVNNELTEKNKQLDLSNQTKHKLFSIIAHDLKNPFFSILGFASIIKDKTSKGEIDEIKEPTEILLSSSMALVEMIDNLSNWAKLQQDEITPNLTYFDIKEEINNIIKLNSANIKLKNIDIKTNIAQDSIIYADKEMIITIIRNLLSNAIKYTPKEGNITISFSKTNSEWIISVKDSGKGISKELIEKILANEKISSVDGTNNEKGTGIGLSISKDFIAAQNGKLIIKEIEGTGTEFTVKMPVIGESVN
jgi:signal transduction histidine kinase